MTPIRCSGHYGPTHLTAGRRQCRLSASSGLPRIVSHCVWKEAKRHKAPLASLLFQLHNAFLWADLWHKSCTSHSALQTITTGWLKHILKGIADCVALVCLLVPPHGETSRRGCKMEREKKNHLNTEYVFWFGAAHRLSAHYPPPQRLCTHTAGFSRNEKKERKQEKRKQPCKYVASKWLQSCVL